MGRRSEAVGNTSMSGEFLIKSHANSKGRGFSGRKCVACLLVESDQVRLQIRNLHSPKAEENVKERVIEAEKWLVYFSEFSQNASLTLVKLTASEATDSFVLEAKNENIAVLKMMEVKLREFLKVISYRIKVQDITSSEKPKDGVLHIMRNKIVILVGFPPDFSILLDYSFMPFENGLTFSPSEGLSFATLPNIIVLGEQIDSIWQTLQGCLQAMGFCGDGSDETLKPSPKTQYVYYNLSKPAKRPCKYVYMNLPDKRRAPALNHDYVNVFHTGSVYQNCWRSCTTLKNEECTQPTELPPPPPPRLKAPPLPPKPKNRPPNSPLPPIPQPQPLSEPPALPLPRLPEKYTRKEIEYVVYSSKPIIGQMFVIQVVFFQKNDLGTLQRIKKLEEEANYHVLKPLPDTISVGDDLRISLLNIDDSCTLKSDTNQVIEYDIVKEAILQSCWLIIEFHLEHNNDTRRNFHGKIVMHPKSASGSASARSKKEIQISTTFQDAIPNPLHTPLPISCDSLKSTGVRKYLEVCSLMDIPCALHNDWTGLAGEVGLTVDEVFKIQSKACFPNFSPTNEVLNIWSQRDKCCNVEQFKVKLKTLHRFDVLAVLDNE